MFYKDNTKVNCPQINSERIFLELGFPAKEQQSEYICLLLVTWYLKSSCNFNFQMEPNNPAI